MWPFKKKQSAADLAVEWMPRAIEVATQKWIEFDAQPFAAGMALDKRLFLFAEGLGRGLKQWKAFKSGPDDIFLLIAAKGVERSKTHLRIEIETALKFPLPLPHVRTDQEESGILTEKLVDRAARKWTIFAETIIFKDDVSLAQKIKGFKMPFLEGVRRDFPMFVGAEDSFFDPTIALGILRTGTHSLDELEAALELCGNEH